MIDLLSLVLTWISGCALGAAFFGGLWFTVNKGLTSDQPALWFLGSLVLRMGIVLVGFYYVSGGNWERLLVCLIGFLMARFVVTWMTRPLRQMQAIPVQEGRHSS